jgi:hypothetical protein
LVRNFRASIGQITRQARKSSPGLEAQTLRTMEEWQMYYCKILEKNFQKGPCLFEKNGTIPGNQTCPQCSYYEEKFIINRSSITGPKRKTAKPKPSLNHKRKTKAAIADQEEIKLKYWKWQFLRRNKEYISDYQKYKDGKEVPNDIRFKWRWGWNIATKRFVDPNNSNPNLERDLELLSVFNLKASTTIDTWFGMNGLAVSLLAPESEVDGKKIEHWSWTPCKKYGKVRTIGEVDKDNWPEKLCMSIEVRPYHHVTKLKEMFMKEFEKQLNSLIKLQKSISRLRPKRTRFDIYEDYLMVYDYKEKNGLTFQEIAKKMFKGDFNPNREKANPESAIKKVQQYYKKAKEMIEGEWDFI